jgi:hypothetical protein
MIKNNIKSNHLDPILSFLEAKGNQVLKRIVKVFLFAGCIFGGLYFWLLFPLDWQTVASKKAPEGSWVVYHLQSRSEAGEAPYGDSIVLAPSYWPLGQYYGEVVFAGYCGTGPEFRWLDKHQLRIEFKAEKIMKMMKSFKDVNIQYEISEETTHNQALGKSVR